MHQTGAFEKLAPLIPQNQVATAAVACIWRRKKCQHSFVPVSYIVGTWCAPPPRAPPAASFASPWPASAAEKLSSDVFETSVSSGSVVMKST